MVELQSRDAVADLKAQFNTLQMQLKSGMAVTPGVKATIDKMVTMIHSQIEPAIHDAHRVDQNDVNTLMNNIQLRNNAWDTQNTILQQDANGVRDLIDDEQAKSATWEKAAGTFTATQDAFLATYGQQTDQCCKRD